MKENIMEGPTICVDVSNGSSHYRAFKKKDSKYGGARKIVHDIDGFNNLLEDVKKLKEVTNEEVCVVYEATGVYTAPLKRFLEKNNVKQFMISPLQSAKKRKEAIHYKKTDKRDPVDIAAVYYEMKDLKEVKCDKGIYKFLRDKNRLYEDRLNHLRKFKVTFQNQLCICFPGFMDLFDDGYSEVSMILIKKYPHPDLIKNKKAETVAAYIEKNTCHTHKKAMEYASDVIEFANKTYSGCDKDDVEVDTFRNLIDKVIETIKECEDILNEIINAASTLEEYEYIKSIDGIGDNLASRIIAEIGDIKRFKTRQALVAYTGLDPHINQSGNISGEHLSITKKGNKYLRCLLYLAVKCSIRTGKSNPVNNFYKKKMQQTNPLNSNAATTACTAKMLKIIYGMCKNKTVYQY